MKKSIKIWLIAAMAAVSGSAWADVTMPDGTYYFDLSALTGSNQAWEIQVFDNINSDSYIGFNGLASCNSGVSQGSNAKIYQNTSTGFNQLVLTISTSFSKGGGFLQVRVGSTNGSTSWKGWWAYTAPTAIGGKKVYVCKVTTTGYTWGTSESDLPSCSGGGAADPTLTVSAGANGDAGASIGGTPHSSGTAVVAGTEVTATAIPNDGYVFAYWTDAGSNIVSYSSTYIFDMPSSNYSITANFTSSGTDASISGCGDCFLVKP